MGDRDSDLPSAARAVPASPIAVLLLIIGFLQPTPYSAILSSQTNFRKLEIICMEPWFNLLIQVAKPILTTLAYTGTNILLDTVQSEIKNHQNKQAKLALKSLGLKESHTAIAEEIIQSTSLIFESDTLENNSVVQSEQSVNGYLSITKQNFLEQLTHKAEETALKLPEINKSLEYWPLRLLPSQLIHSRLDDCPIPLKIFIAPPQKSLEEFKYVGIEIQEIEQILTQNLREFLGQNYSSQCSVRPTEFLGGAWNQHNFHGEASIKVLFGALQTQPTLILETGIESNYIVLRLGYWGGQQKQYCYETLLKLPYRRLLQTSIEARALRWKETKHKLVELGKSPEEVAKLGGDNDINLAILEEVAELQAAGIETEELSFVYQVNRQDFEYICQFLSICQCLVAGWVTDIHYLIENNLAPHLPTWLPQLIGESGEESEFLSAIMGASISIYQRILQVLIQERPNSIPRLSLKLARSILQFDLSLAKEQIEYSWQHWLQQHQLFSAIARLDLDRIQANITTEDWEYLIDLQACLSLLDDQSSIAPIQDLINTLCDRRYSSYSQKAEHFALDYTVTEISGQVGCLWLDSTNCKLIGKSANRTLDLWQLKRRKVQLSPTHQLRGYSGKAIALTLSPDGDRLVCSDTTAKRSYLRIWNLQTGKLEQTLFGHKQSIKSLVISSGDRPFLASGSHKIKLWDLKTGEPWLTLFGHKQWVYALAIVPDGQTLVSGSEDKTIRIWHLSKGDLRQTLTGHQGEVKVIAIAPDGQTIVSGSDDRTIKLWDIKTGKLLRTLTGHTGGISTLAIDPNGQYLVSGSEDKTIKIWHFETGELRQTLSGHRQTVRTLAIHPHRQTIVSGSDDKTVKFWRII
ncbi:MAG: WD40 repeat domain-containing protein [Xenococcaceae cyanobacterium MO_188.B29]|nr:WD40 repeat domain-containing protein [Xenococcaceae cyanobacterium MO_188.B29]